MRALVRSLGYARDFAWRLGGRQNGSSSNPAGRATFLRSLFRVVRVNARYFVSTANSPLGPHGTDRVSCLSRYRVNRHPSPNARANLRRPGRL